jgi:hypothetical protein
MASVKGDLAHRLDGLVERLRTVYDGIGHSSGRPFVYFVYLPEQERELGRLCEEYFHDDASLSFHRIDLLQLTIEALKGNEEKRGELLNDASKGSGAAQAIMRLWARNLSREIARTLEESTKEGRPVIVLKGLAALHPLGHPTMLMEQVAEHEPHDPKSDAMVPIVLFVPGMRPPQSSRQYLFLGLETLQLNFYRGEEA